MLLPESFITNLFTYRSFPFKMDILIQKKRHFVITETKIFRFSLFNFPQRHYKNKKNFIIEYNVFIKISFPKNVRYFNFLSI